MPNGRRRTGSPSRGACSLPKRTGAWSCTVGIEKVGVEVDEVDDDDRRAGVSNYIVAGHGCGDGNRGRGPECLRRVGSAPRGV